MKLFLQVRDADVLLIEAIDWASRQVRYLINGERRSATLAAEQVEALRSEGQKAAE